MDSGKPTLINAVIDPAAGSESGRIGNLNPQSVLRKKKPSSVKPASNTRRRRMKQTLYRTRRHTAPKDQGDGHGEKTSRKTAPKRRSPARPLGEKPVVKIKRGAARSAAKSARAQRRKVVGAQRHGKHPHGLPPRRRLPSRSRPSRRHGNRPATPEHQAVGRGRQGAGRGARSRLHPRAVGADLHPARSPTWART